MSIIQYIDISSEWTYCIDVSLTLYGRKRLMSMVIRRCGHTLACFGNGVLWGADKVSRLTGVPDVQVDGFEDEENEPYLQ